MELIRPVNVAQVHFLDEDRKIIPKEEETLVVFCMLVSVVAYWICRAVWRQAGRPL